MIRPSFVTLTPEVLLDRRWLDNSLIEMFPSNSSKFYLQFEYVNNLFGANLDYEADTTIQCRPV